MVDKYDNVKKMLIANINVLYDSLSITILLSFDHLWFSLVDLFGRSLFSNNISGMLVNLYLFLNNKTSTKLFI